MKLTAAVLSACFLLPAPLLAQQARVFDNPCERGPLPHWSVINEKRDSFVAFLQEVRPRMPRDVANLIAYEMCNDMSLVGNSDGLTERLNLLLRNHGY